MIQRKRCGVHIPEARGFCSLEKGHADEHSKYPADQGVGASPNLAFTQVKIAEVEAQLSRLRIFEADEKAELFIKCMGWTAGSPNGCGAMLPINELVYIQTFWYTQPHGCAGGDYWNLGEGQFECPKCGILNRLYERPDVEALKSSFGSVVEQNDR